MKELKLPEEGDHVLLRGLPIPVVIESVIIALAGRELDVRFSGHTESAPSIEVRARLADIEAWHKDWRRVGTPDVKAAS